jgi:hypothetical protein
MPPGARLIILGLVVVVCRYSWWSTGTNEDKEGQDALAAKKYDGAVTHFNQTIRLAPESVRRGNCLSQLSVRGDSGRRLFPAVSVGVAGALPGAVTA